MRQGWFFKIFLAIVFIILVSVRCLHLTADAPLSFPNGWRSYETFTDEAAKAYQSRNYALFGKWNTSAQDQYQIWKTLSPVWVYPLMLWFKAFGVSYTTLRIFSIVWFVIGLLLILLLWRTSILKNAGVYAVLFFNFNFFLFIYSRLGLMETMLNTFLLLSVCLLAFSFKQKWFFPLSLLAFLSAYFIKQNALLMAPVFIAGYFLTFGNPVQKKFWLNKANWASVLIAILSISMLYYLWHQPAYRLFTIMNIRHGYGLPPDTSRTGLVIRTDFIRDSISYHLSLIGLWQTYFAFDPVVSALALVEIICIIYFWFRHKKQENVELLLLVWLLCFRFFLAESSARVERFWLPQVPAMLLLAGAGLSRIAQLLDKKSARLKIILVSMVILLSFAWNFYFWLKWFSHPRYELISAGKKLEQALGDKPAVVIGKWAGPLLFPSKHQYYYVKNIFNRKPQQLNSFGINYILLGEAPLLVRYKFELEQDSYQISFQQAFPKTFAEKKLITEVPFYEGKLLLYQVSF